MTTKYRKGGTNWEIQWNETKKIEIAYLDESEDSDALTSRLFFFFLEDWGDGMTKVPLLIVGLQGTPLP